MKTLLRILAGLLILAGLACLGWYFRPVSDTGNLTWEPPVVKKSLMTFAYKVYGNPAAQNGRNVTSKIVFVNKGTGPVRDFSVSYQIPDYIPWTTPDANDEIQPGQTVVKLYYPQLPAKVTQLTADTTVTLETKIRWSDRPGNTREEVLRSNVELRGVNEIEYTDMPASEVLNWYDQFATAPFSAAMVTPNDPVVKEFVAEVTRRTGGTTAGIAGGPQEISRIMNAVYDYMCETGMRYTSDSGVPNTLGDVTTTVQTVRLPRDVIITNEGLCVELALLWASVMEHLGLRSTVVFVPGHAFTIVWVGQGPNDYIPVECTAITPMAVGSKTPLSFNDAVAFAQKEMQQDTTRIPIDVQQYQQQGFWPPELPPIDIDKIINILAQRRVQKPIVVATAPANNGNTASAPSAPAVPAVPSGGAPGPVVDGYFRYVGADGWVRVDIPAQWTRVENGPIPGMIFTAQDAKTTVGVNVFQFRNLQSAEDAIHTVQESFSSKAGIKLRIVGRQKNNELTLYSGTASSRYGNNKWVGVFRPTQAGVLGFFVGAEAKQFEHNQKLIEYVISTARFGQTP